MRFARAAAVAAVAATMISTGLAEAAPKPRPKPLCQQITDPAGDAVIGGSLNKANAPTYDSLDILSADVATGPHNVIAALRLKTTTRDALLVGGATYEFRWVMGDVTYSFFYRIFQSGETEAMLHASTYALNADIPITASVDPASATLSWSAQRKLFPELKKPGAKLTQLSAYSASADNLKSPGGTTRGSTGVDSVVTTKSYVDLYPTCLKGA